MGLLSPQQGQWPPWALQTGQGWPPPPQMGQFQPPQGMPPTGMPGAFSGQPQFQQQLSGMIGRQGSQSMAGPVSYTPNPPPDLSWLPKPDVAVGGKKKNNDAYNILAKPQIAITDALTGNWLFKLFG